MTAPPGQQPRTDRERLVELIVPIIRRPCPPCRAQGQRDDGICPTCRGSGTIGPVSFEAEEYAERVLDAVLPAHEATVRRELHFPTIAPMASGEWGVHCFACSEAAGDYVPRCLHDRDDWPPTLMLRDAPPSTLVDALADKRQAEHTRGDT